MARISEPTKAEERDWKRWVAKRPAVVKAICERLDPWTLYRMKPTGDRVTLYSASEDGTVTVNVLAEFNLTMFERRVFGIDPDDLEPCELPAPEEPVGAMLSGEEVDDNIDVLRAMARPDLWAMGDDGKAKRKN